VSAQPDPLAALIVAGLDDQALAALAARLAPHLPDRHADEWLAPAGAARHLGVTVRRIHDLTSNGRLTPDGRDGRRPLWRRSTLDAYAAGDRRSLTTP
jgi:hypothetical protein